MYLLINFFYSFQSLAYVFVLLGFKPLDWQVESGSTIKVGSGFVLEALVSVAQFPPNPANEPFGLGLTAVIETITGEKSYWALHHPVLRPDFHHRDGFTPLFG